MKTLLKCLPVLMFIAIAVGAGAQTAGNGNSATGNTAAGNQVNHTPNTAIKSDETIGYSPGQNVDDQNSKVSSNRHSMKSAPGNSDPRVKIGGGTNAMNETATGGSAKATNRSSVSSQSSKEAVVDTTSDAGTDMQYNSANGGTHTGPQRETMAGTRSHVQLQQRKPLPKKGHWK